MHPDESNPYAPPQAKSPIAQPAESGRKRQDKTAALSFWLSLLALLIFWVPIFSSILASISLILGEQARRESDSTLGTTGILIGASALTMSLPITLGVLIGGLFD